jgi:hypothetical protein
MKELSGTFHRIYRVKGGLYGIETITVSKGKVTDSVIAEENYPTVTMAKFNKVCFAEAQDKFDKDSQEVS